MKLTKLLILIVLSFSVATLGIGFAAINTELGLTGYVDFQHTGLYISNIISGSGVNVTGCSGTLMNLTATSGSTMTVSITNPTSDTNYYLNYTAGDHTISLSDIALGSRVSPDATITFTITFTEEIDHSHAIKFNFTLIPPEIPTPDEPDPDLPDTPGGTTNAIAAIEFVINHIDRGLNSSANKHTFEQWCNKNNTVLHCRDNTISGGNLNNEFASLGAQDVLFTLEWKSETQYNIYLYYTVDATKENAEKGAYITVYNQYIVYNSIDKVWSAADSYKGLAKVQSEKNGYGIETAVDENGNSYVVWYANESELPTVN